MNNSKVDYALDDIYNFYKKKQKLKNRKVVNRKIFGKIIRNYNREICKYIVNDSEEFRMPFRVGYLRIRKFKQRLILDPDGKLKTRHFKVDWKKTNELWNKNEEAKKAKKVVYHINEHSNRYYFKWYWFKITSNIKNVHYYTLVMSRQNKRLIAKALNENDKLDYYE